MAKLIGKGKCRRALANLQPDRRSHVLASRVVFLRARKNEQSEGEKHGNYNSHLSAPDSITFPDWCHRQKHTNMRIRLSGVKSVTDLHLFLSMEWRDVLALL